MINNQRVQVYLKQLPNGRDLPIPKYETENSAGVDLRAATNEDIILHPGEVKLIPTGIAIELPNSFEAQVRPRSGLALKHHVTVLNSPGTIDADYRGEINVILINHSSEIFTVSNGMRIAQLIIAPVVTAEFVIVDALTETARGEKGFGSTGLTEKVNVEENA